MAFGVDFGTTNSSVAWADPAGDVHSLSVRSSKEPFDAVVRSVVLDPCGKFGEPVVGDLAFEEAAMRSGDAPLLRSFKFKLDQQRLRQSLVQIEWVANHEYDPVNQANRLIPRRMVTQLYDEHSRDEVVAAAAQVLKRLLSPDPAIQSSSVPSAALNRLLGSLRKDKAESGPDAPDGFDSEEDEWLYVGVPVAAGPTARKRLLSALARTDLFGMEPKSYQNVLRRCRFVYEPLAIASTLQLLDSQTVLVFDYGGGSLDLALLDITFDHAGSAYRERALGGVANAGDRLDELFRETLIAHDTALRRAYEIELRSESPFDRWRAENFFSSAKIELSSSTSTTLRLPGFERKVNRSEFEGAIEPAIVEVLNAVDDCLHRGGIAAREVGQVVLTGGSSLIPTMQDRLRGVFSHLDDTSFVAGRPGDLDSEREALTGVSRGLAKYGFISQFFEATAPCDFGIWSADGKGFTPCLERGASATFDVAEAPAKRIHVGQRRPASFALYSNLVRDAFCGALADIEIPEGVDEVEVRVAASRRRFVPAFAVYIAGTSQELATFDLEALSATRLAKFIESDEEWLPEGDHLVSAFLTRPLQKGDFVEWRARGQYHHRGKVMIIRDVGLNESVERMHDVNPLPYRISVAFEETSGVVDLRRTLHHDWKMGDVRLV